MQHLRCSGLMGRWLRSLVFSSSSNSLLPSVEVNVRQISHSLSNFSSKKRKKFIKPIVYKKFLDSATSINVFDRITIRELCSVLSKTEDELLEVLFDLDKKFASVSSDYELDKKTISKVLSNWNLKAIFVARPKVVDKVDEDIIDVYAQPLPPEDQCQRRPPIITIMGHVDHGKTTLLDCLRKSRVVESEFGGITQHIGAFTLRDDAGNIEMTFLDTPGHAAFAQMRQRGASSTDIVVLVVAADDGVMDQTVQSIRYAKEAGVPIVVAVNKCDKPNANPLRVRNSLTEHGVVVEDFYGDSLSVDISALHGTNISALKEAILLQAADSNLLTTQEGDVEGIIIESTTRQGLGKVCSIIVQRGILKRGKVLVAGPSCPVEISGWKNGSPCPGEKVYEVEDADRAKRIVEYRAMKEERQKAENELMQIEQEKEEERRRHREYRKILFDRGIRFGSVIRHIIDKEQRYTKAADCEHPVLKVILCSDVDGTLEAILEVIDSYNSPEVDLQLVDFGVRVPCLADIELASELDATVICFNVETQKSVKEAAEKLKVKIVTYNVIYHFVDGLKELLNDQIVPRKDIKMIGEGRVVKQFLLSGFGEQRLPVAGVKITWGMFDKSNIFKFIRKNSVVYKGPVESMKRSVEVVSTARAEQEVGLALANKEIRFKKDDIVEAYSEEMIKPVITWNPPGF